MQFKAAHPSLLPLEKGEKSDLRQALFSFLFHRQGFSLKLLRFATRRALLEGKKELRIGIQINKHHQRKG